MPTLLLLRHGKSDWDAPSTADHERPLARRGIKAAKAVGRFLAATSEVPGEVFTSTAVRARKTVELAAEAGGWACPVRLVPELYGATPAAVLALVRAYDGPASTLLLAGHEPTWSELLTLLTGGGRCRFPTAAVAALHFEVETFGEVGPGGGELLWLLPPRLLPAVGFK